MDPALIYGPYGAIVCLLGGLYYLNQDNKTLAKENKELRDKSMALLQKYQDRDEEELKLLREGKRRQEEVGS